MPHVLLHIQSHVVSYWAVDPVIQVSSLTTSVSLLYTSVFIPHTCILPLFRTWPLVLSCMSLYPIYVLTTIPPFWIAFV